MTALLSTWTSGPFVFISSLDVYGLDHASPITEDTPARPFNDYTAAEWTQYRDAWVDVRDLATIVADSIARPAGGPLNVLTGQYSWHDLYADLIRLSGSRSNLVHRPLDDISDDELPNKQLYAQTWEFSEARLARHLGRIPRRSFEITIRDTVGA